uniref:BED-type domain-containing protein n=1 Tax=Hordeum vulgare subsp. vulgare TaxID=112509 RepID=A0A8I6YG94_HORVV
MCGMLLKSDKIKSLALMCFPVTLTIFFDIYFDPQRLHYRSERQKKKQRQKAKRKRLEGKREEKREEKRKKQEKKRKNQKEELQGKRKHARSEFIQGSTREELQSRDSPSMTHGQRVTRSPLVGSPVANTWRSSLGVLARVAASKKSSAMSPSILGPPSPATTSFVPRIRKTRRLTSAVWRDAKPIYHRNILVKAQCNHCLEVFPAGRGVGTNGVQRHLAACEKRLDLSLVVDKLKSSISSPHGSMLQQWSFDQIASRKLLARMIVMDELPFSFVEYSGFRDFVESLNPLFSMVSRGTIKDDCMEQFNQERLKFCEGFKKYRCRVSLTADMWTSNQTLSYLCITCHFVSNWALRKQIIRFFMVETPHNGISMFNVLLKSLQDWNIEDKLFSTTLDNAAVNGTMVEYLRIFLNSKHMLPIEGQLFHIRCACHVLNLIVQDGLTVMKGVIDNIRESAKYVKSFPSRLDKFKAVIAEVGISCKLPSVDVPTRWNFTFLMLESSLPFRRAFRTLVRRDKDYKFCPSSEEWKRAETVCAMLRVFHTATEVVSGSSYPTSNMYFHQIWNVRVLLQKEASSENDVIRAMVVVMQAKFDKYWIESYLPNCIAVILDPRFKLSFFEFRLKQAFCSDIEKHLDAVKNTLNSLFEEYSSQMADALGESTQGQKNDEVMIEENDPLADWDQHLHQKQRQSANELDRYLEEETFDRGDNFNILQWWYIHSLKYPILSCIARDVLAVPASVVPSESAFSTGHRVVSDYRSRLSNKTVEALICHQDWYKSDVQCDIVQEDHYY